MIDAMTVVGSMDAVQCNTLVQLGDDEHDVNSATTKGIEAAC